MRMKDEIYKNRLLVTAVLLLLCTAGCDSQLSKLKFSKSRAGSSKFSLNPLKPLMKLVRDPLKASAQRHYPRYLPPPPGMFQPPVPQVAPPVPPRASAASTSNSPWQRYYGSQNKVHPPAGVSLMPPMTAMPSSMVYSTLVSDRYKPYHGYSGVSPLSSDIQIKTVRLPSRYRKPAVATPNLNLADSVVRQILDIPNSDTLPSVLVIEDPDVSATQAASTNSDVFSESVPSQKPSPTILVAPPINADLSDASADLTLPGNNNPDVFVIVSKNSKNKGLFAEDKKGDIISTASSTPKMKKYKITSGLDEFGNSGGSRQVWIIK